MTELEQIKIELFDFVKYLSFTFLATQLSTKKNLKITTKRVKLFSTFYRV